MLTLLHGKKTLGNIYYFMSCGKEWDVLGRGGGIGRGWLPALALGIIGVSLCTEDGFCFFPCNPLPLIIAFFLVFRGCSSCTPGEGGPISSFLRGCGSLTSFWVVHLVYTCYYLLPEPGDQAFWIAANYLLLGTMFLVCYRLCWFYYITARCSTSLLEWSRSVHVLSSSFFI